MKKNLFALIILAGVALAFTGCGSIGEVVLLDGRVENSITHGKPLDTRLPDGRLQVTARLRNLENRRLQVQVNCQFKDEQGVVIDATPFENVILTENAQEDVQFVSMSDKAQRYVIRVREAH